MVPYSYDPRYTRLRSFHSFSSYNRNYDTSDKSIEAINCLLDLVDEKKLPLPVHISQSSFGFLIEWEDEHSTLMVELQDEDSSMRLEGFIEAEEIKDIEGIQDPRSLIDFFPSRKKEDSK